MSQYTRPRMAAERSAARVSEAEECRTRPTNCRAIAGPNVSGACTHAERREDCGMDAAAAQNNKRSCAWAACTHADQAQRSRERSEHDILIAREAGTRGEAERRRR